MDRSVRNGYAVGFALTLMWASWILATRAGMESSLLTYDLLALRLGGSALLTLPFLFYFKLWRGLSFGQYVVLALLGGLPQIVLSYEAIERSPVAQVSVFMYGTAPFLTALLALLFLRRRMTQMQIAGTLITFLGILVMSINEFGTVQNMDIWIGNLMAVVAITSFAGYLIFAERWQITIGQAILSCSTLNAFAFLPYWYFFQETGVHSAPFGEILGQGLLQGAIPGVVAVLATTYVTARVGAKQVSVFYALIPVCASALAIPVLGEPVDLFKVSGISIATIGLLLSSIEEGALGRLKMRFQSAS